MLHQKPTIIFNPERLKKIKDNNNKPGANNKNNFSLEANVTTKLTIPHSMLNEILR